MLVAAQHHSGLVLGAYDGRRMVGVLFGFTALAGRKPYHYSHITGVAREYQSRGVGFKLKLAQRKSVIRQGQSLVKWTYDPLQASNAYFNIRKLGAVCRTYLRNLYGSLDDSLNRGRVTDRFEVEWWVRSKKVVDRLSGKHRPATLRELVDRGAEYASVTVKEKERIRRPTPTRLGLRGRRLLIEIPEQIARVARMDEKLAREWTLTARRVFENYFRRGYFVVDVIVETEDSGRRVFYLLERE